MNIQSPPILPPMLPRDAACDLRVGVSSKARPVVALWKLLIAALKFFWGMVFCQSLIGSLLVIGWTYRMAQRSALREWWRRSPLGKQAGLSFQDFLSGSERTEQHRSWPNWFCRQNFADEWRSRARLQTSRQSVFRFLSGSLHKYTHVFFRQRLRPGQERVCPAGRINHAS